MIPANVLERSHRLKSIKVREAAHTFDRLDAEKWKTDALYVRQENRGTQQGVRSSILHWELRGTVGSEDRVGTPASAATL